MNTSELRKRIEEHPKYKGTKIIEPSSLINSGFPSCFNLSFGEGPMHELFGQYLDYTSDLIFSTIQPCIRHEDWQTIKKNDSKRYLNLFDMAGIGGMSILLDGKKLEEITKFHMKSEIDFLINLGLDINKLGISYFVETPVFKATKGKYNIDKIFPTDIFYNYWIELGLKKEQLIPDQTRDTMLALNVFGLPTPWGYRYEILYEYNNELWDIGTVEYLMYRPIFDDENKIIDIVPFNHCLAASVVGLERISTIINNKNAVWETDTIYPLIELVKEKSNSGDEFDSVILVQAFRAIHKIVSEGFIYSSLNTRRKEYIRNFYREFFDRCKNLGINYSSNFIKEIGLLNSKINPWYSDLESSMELLISEFDLRKQTFDNDKSKKNRGVAQ